MIQGRGTEEKREQKRRGNRTEKGNRLEKGTEHRREKNRKGNKAV